MKAGHAALIAIAGVGATAALAIPHQAHAHTALEPVRMSIQAPSNDDAQTLVVAPSANAQAVDACQSSDTPFQRTRAATEQRALSALARLFHEPVFDRERWERAASVLASSLDRRDVARLAEVSGELGIDEVLAAAALLTHAQRDGARAAHAPTELAPTILAPTALAALRTAWSGAVGPERSSAAVRSLLALGDISDRRGVLAELHAPDADRRSRASWGLQGSGGAQLVSEVVDEFGALRVEQDDVAALQALTALRSIVAQTDDFRPEQRRSLELRLLEILEEEDPSSAMHLRATAVLASLR